MPLLTRKMPSWEGVGAGQTATIRLPVGLRFHKLITEYSGLTLAQMDEIRVIANGKTIMRYNGGDILDSINKFDGRAAAAGVLTVDFERYGLRTRAGSELTVIDTTREALDQISTLTVEMDINASATAPVLKAPKAVQSGSVGGGEQSRLLKHVRIFGYDPAGSGEYEISDLPKMGAINRVIFHSPTSAINAIKLQRDNYDVFDRTTTENETIQADGVRVPQSDFYVVDFSEEGNSQDFLTVRGVRDLRFRLEMADAGHVDAIVEYIDMLGSA